MGVEKTNVCVIVQINVIQVKKNYSEYNKFEKVFERSKRIFQKVLERTGILGKLVKFSRKFQNTQVGI